MALKITGLNPQEWSMVETFLENHPGRPGCESQQSCRMLTPGSLVAIVTMILMIHLSIRISLIYGWIYMDPLYIYVWIIMDLYL
jgi:hypothetical protein